MYGPWVGGQRPQPLFGGTDMQLQQPKDLCLYELSAMYNGEKTIVEMLKEVAADIDNDTLADMMRTHQSETKQQAQILEECFERLGESPQDIPCGVVDTIRKEYKDFRSRQPSSQVLTMFALGGAMKIEHFEIASYRALVDQALAMGDPGLAQSLTTILKQEEETAGKLERFAHELDEKVLQPS
ncbi:ferritin-like domain-containing protein [Streptomonospora sediminis]